MFIGRKNELEALEKEYLSDRFEFAVIYGRKRVGKTTLIREFVRGKKCIYYMAVEGTSGENLSGLSQTVMQKDSPIHGSELTFSSFSALLDHIDTLCSKERLILAIDEYPYLAASYPAISSLIQKHIDLCWKESRLFLILCGSSMSFMERQVLGYKSPLYGRRTIQCRLKAFSYFEAKPMLSAWRPEDSALLYGITGGIPDYLDRLDTNISAADNIRALFFHESGHLYEEPVNLLKQELREPASYHSILTAIAGGAGKIHEISQKTGLETSGCSNQLSALIALGIVKKEIPVTEKETSRKTRYKISDSMFQFWYRFVRPNRGSISMGIGDMAFDQAVQSRLSDYMGHIFEDICAQYLYLPQVCSSFPFIYSRIGRWWGNDPVRKCQEEVDLAAPGEDSILLCECKWRNEKTGVDTARTLLRRGELFVYSQKAFCIFSKSGFEENVPAFAAEHGIRLVSFDDMQQT